MPRDANGNYSLPAQYFVQNGDTVLPVQHNPPFEDVAQALTNSVAKDGRTVMTGDLKMGGFKVTGLVDGESETDAVNVRQARGFLGVISINSFGADPSGVEDSTQAVISAFAAANSGGLTLTGSGKFRLVGSDVIVLTTNADLSNVVFDASEWTGYFHINRTKPMVEYTIGDVVDGIAVSSDIGIGSACFDGWEDVSEVNNSFVVIETDQDFYTYRGDVQKRVEINRVFKDGRIESPLKYSLDDVTVTAVKVFPLEDRRREVKGLTIDISGTSSPGREWVEAGQFTGYVLVSTSKLDIDVTFIQYEGDIDSNPQLVRFDDYYDVKARLHYDWPWHSTSTVEGGGFNYLFQINGGMNIDVEATGQGDGWGATSGNEAKRVTFRNSNLNRIDFHRPFHDWLRVRESSVGSWGILVTALGDLDVDTVQFTQVVQKNSNNRGIIRSRADTGGFCDGDLLMRNITVTADDGVGQTSMFQHQQSGTGTAKPAGSPINYCWWNRIIVDGVKYRMDEDAEFLRFEPFDIASGPATVAVASEVIFRDIMGHNNFVCDLTDDTPQRAGDFPVKITCENVTAEVISIRSSDNNCPVVAMINNCRGSLIDGVNLELMAPGEYTINSGCAVRLDFFNANSTVNYPLYVQAYGVTFVDDGTVPLLNIPSDLTDIRLVDCEFRTTTESRLYALLRAMLIRPKFIVSGTRQRLRLSNDLNGSTGIWTLNGNCPDGQPVIARWNTNAATECEFRMPPVGQGVALVAHLAGTGAVTKIISRTDETSIETGGNCTPRYLEIG